MSIGPSQESNIYITYLKRRDITIHLTRRRRFSSSTFHKVWCKNFVLTHTSKLLIYTIEKLYILQKNCKKCIAYYFQCIRFLSFFSMRPMPSKTLVMSYILRFCTYTKGELKFIYDIGRKNIRYYGNNLVYKKQTSKVSAALFRSRIPSSACLTKLMNFFVNRPVKFWYNFVIFFS